MKKSEFLEKLEKKTIKELRVKLGLQVPEEGEVECLKCLKTFISEDRKTIRRCPSCTEKLSLKDDSGSFDYEEDLGGMW